MLAAVLDGALRLMHPMIPFITETIWWSSTRCARSRGLPGRLECPPSKRLVLAKWPAVGDFSEAAEHIFPRLQEIIGAIRNVRNEHKVNPKQDGDVSIRPRLGADPADRSQPRDDRAAGDVQSQASRSEHCECCKCSDNDRRQLRDFVEGLVDPNAEKQRLTKLKEDVQKKIDSINGRLGSEAYVAKAPAHVVQQSRDQLAALEAETEEASGDAEKSDRIVGPPSRRHCVGPQASANSTINKYATYMLQRQSR